MEIFSDSESDGVIGEIERWQKKRNLETNDQIIARLKRYTDLSDIEVDEYAHFMVAPDYFKLPDHRGGAIVPGNKHYRSNGKEFTIADVLTNTCLKE
jgi:DNA segregation ATPase FtsK/SpoIIIE-like protein